LTYLARVGVNNSGEGLFDWISDTERFQMMEQRGFLAPDRVRAWKALHQLLSQPWFGRGWTLQELVVSRAGLVLCGGRTVAWEVLELAIRVCDVTYSPVHELANTTNNTISPEQETQQACATVVPYTWPPYHLDAVNGIASTRSQYRFLDNRSNGGYMIGTPATFARANSASSRLTLNITRGCSLVYDKIYSVLGILLSELRDAIQPDYSVPARTVLRRAAKACVEATGWLNIIRHSQSAYSPDIFL